MQSTGQTSTQPLSFTLMHGSAMIYAIRASLANRSPGEISLQVLDGPHHFYPNGNGVSSLGGLLERAELRIQGVPERVPEQVEGEDPQADGQSREDGHPGGGLGEL